MSAREPLIKSGSYRLSVKMFWYKAWNARNSKAIAKFHNAETGRFDHKMSIHDLISGSLVKLGYKYIMTARFFKSDQSNRMDKSIALISFVKAPVEM